MARVCFAMPTPWPGGCGEARKPKGNASKPTLSGIPPAFPLFLVDRYVFEQSIDVIGAYGVSTVETMHEWTKESVFEMSIDTVFQFALDSCSKIHHWINDDYWGGFALGDVPEFAVFCVSGAWEWYKQAVRDMWTWWADDTTMVIVTVLLLCIGPLLLIAITLLLLVVVLLGVRKNLIPSPFPPTSTRRRRGFLVLAFVCVGACTSHGTPPTLTRHVSTLCRATDRRFPHHHRVRATLARAGMPLLRGVHPGVLRRPRHSGPVDVDIRVRAHGLSVVIGRPHCSCSHPRARWRATVSGGKKSCKTNI